MMRRLYNWMMQAAGDERAPWALAIVSFIESSFFPIPPDIMLIPMALARPERAYALAAWCTLTSVAGGLLGYSIGALLYDSVGAWLIQLYGYGNKVEAFRQAYAQWGAWIILIKGVTPIPYKIVTILSGAAAFDFWMFLAASIVTRGARFFLVTALLKRFGAPIRAFIERRLTLMLTIFLVALIGGFVAVKFLF